MFEIWMSGAHIPMDLEPGDIAGYFLQSLGLIGGRAKDLEAIKATPQYRIFTDYLLSGEWGVKDISLGVGLSLAGTYRHISKFHALDLIEEMEEGDGKTIRLRYNSLSRAWGFTSLNIENLLEIYGAIARAMDEHFVSEYGISYNDIDSSSGMEVPSEFSLRLTSMSVGLKERIDAEGIKAGEEEKVLKDLFNDLGLVSARGTLDRGEKSVVRAFVQGFLRYPERLWGYEDLCAHLGLSRPTVYRVVTKLSKLDILAFQDDDGRMLWRMKWPGLGATWDKLSSYHIRYIMDMYTDAIKAIEKGF